MTNRHPFHDAEDVESLLTQMVGAGSVCWKGGPHGIFDAGAARQVVRQGLERLKELTTEPSLGLATNRELLEELTARIEVHGPGLDYRTVDSH